MIYKASKLIAEAFDEAGIKYGGVIEETSDSSYVEAGFHIDNGPSVLAKFISKDDDNDVAVRVYGIINFTDESKRPALMRKINELNCKYRYFNFSCDDDNDVNMEYDFPQKISDESVGPVAVEIFIRFMQIANSMYPELMKALWA